MDNNVETTQCCGGFGFCWETEYDQKDIESIMDDYGGIVILIDDDTKSQEIIAFSECSNKAHGMGYYTVTMVSDDSSCLLVLVFKQDNSGRKLISGQLIKNVKVFKVAKYNIYPGIDHIDQHVAFARCVYKI
jgi:hypothetical protein